MPEHDDRRRLRVQIGENLKRAFDETVAEDIPDRLKDVVASLRTGGASVDQTAPVDSLTGGEAGGPHDADH